MRNISPASMAMLSEKTGVEPVNTVEVYWTDPNPTIYTDRFIPDLGITGRILELTNLENVVNFNGNANSSSITIRLSDHDGSLKTIFDNNDVHKRRVVVKQWFKGLPYSEAFIIYEGQVHSPIIWKEGDRTLSFEVVSKIEDLEVGFSAEEGSFQFIPAHLVGKAWPMVFGTAYDVPAMKLDLVPVGALAAPLNIGNQASIGAKLIAGNTQAQKALQLGLQWLLAALQAYNTAEDLNLIGDVTTANQFLALGDRYTNRGNQFIAEYYRIQRDNPATFSIPINSSTNTDAAFIKVLNGYKFPQNEIIDINVGGAVVQGVFNGNNFSIQKAVHPIDAGSSMVQTGPVTVDDRATVIEYRQDQVGFGQDFYYLFGGTAAYINSVLNDWQVRYLIAGVTGPVNLITVRAFKNLIATSPSGGSGTQGLVLNTNPNPNQAGVGAFGKVLTTVPSNLYNVQNVNFGGIPATILTMPQPLSSLGEGWEDEIYCTIQSTIGPDVVNILIWLIQNYTSHTYDPTSFATVQQQLQWYPANFALLKRVNILKLLEDIAYQSRCAIYLKNGVFYLKYLAVQEAPVDTISESDVLHQSLEVTTQDTEQLYTKVIAKWNDTYSNPTDYLVILRSNIQKYGVREKTVDYFIYNNVNEVVKSATFWLIRDSNSFKTIRIKVPLTKIALETWDTVLLNFNHTYVANGPVIGIIMSNQLDSHDLTITLDIWVPVLMGTMTQFAYALPAGSSIDLIWPFEQPIAYGGVFGGEAYLTQGKPLTVNIPQTTRKYFANNQRDTANDVPPIQTSVDTTQISRGGGPASGSQTTTTTFRQYKFKEFSDDQPVPLPGTFPGQIQSQSGNDPTMYTVNVYTQGLAGQPTSIQVKQLDQDQGEMIPNGTWVEVSKSVFPDPNASDPSQAQLLVEYTMQAPIWL